MLTKPLPAALLLIALLLAACQPNTNRKAAVVSQIKKASKLATTEIVLTKVIGATKAKKVVFFKMKDVTFLANSEATLKLGIDLNKLGPDDVTITNNVVSINLPAVEVINFSYPIDKVKINTEYSDLRNFGNGFKVEDFDEVFRQTELAIRAQINALDITQQAENKTIQFLERFLSTAGFTEVYITFKASDKPLLEVGTTENIFDQE